MKFRVRHEWRIGGLYRPSLAAPGPAVLMLHGFPGVLKNEDMAADLCRRGMTVLMPYYGGCWGSPGSFSVRGAFDDARAGLKLLSRYGRVDARRLGVLGYSFGGWAALRLAAEARVAAVAALAPALPHGDGAETARYLRRFARVVRIPSLSGAWSEYDSASREDRPDDYLPRIPPAAVLLVEGRRDRLVPPESTARLWSRVSTPKELASFPDEDHEFLNDRPKVVAAVCGWLQSRLA
ncbi:MAG TPA: alpha/beta fold hydrolase [Elusimicrobiota bacterium]|nr:alpha/beta fold hydrolase [Elusimicrobiota bacterium]